MSPPLAQIPAGPRPTARTGHSKAVPTGDAKPARAWAEHAPKAAAAVLLAAVLAFGWWWLAHREPPDAPWPEEPTAAASRSPGPPAPAGAHARAAEPPERQWPGLARGVELLERNRHAEAAAFFQDRLKQGGLPPDETGMALYFQADCLFSQDRLAEAAVLYRKVVVDHGHLPAADNARSALEYIANADRFRKALAGGPAPR